MFIFIYNRNLSNNKLKNLPAFFSNFKNLEVL